MGRSCKACTDRHGFNRGVRIARCVDFDKCAKGGRSKARRDRRLFFKTEMDKEMLAAYSGHIVALEKLKEATSIEDFSHTPHYQSIRTHLDVNELISIGINRKVFDQRVCYGFWYTVLTTLCRDAAKVIEHARNQPYGDGTYDQIKLVNARWSGRPFLFRLCNHPAPHPLSPQAGRGGFNPPPCAPTPGNSWPRG